jgi:hypothetical protein
VARTWLTSFVLVPTNAFGECTSAGCDWEASPRCLVGESSLGLDEPGQPRQLLGVDPVGLAPPGVDEAHVPGVGDQDLVWPWSSKILLTHGEWVLASVATRIGSAPEKKSAPRKPPGSWRSGPLSWIISPFSVF